ncbi:hypothetical protein B0H13DRAFT_1921921 [Mycena leptocephala]|nr:hypothetical protein B0H13DRAFT_1921921 [Mycena leptocephala]
MAVSQLYWNALCNKIRLFPMEDDGPEVEKTCIIPSVASTSPSPPFDNDSESESDSSSDSADVEAMDLNATGSALRVIGGPLEDTKRGFACYVAYLWESRRVTIRGCRAGIMKCREGQTVVRAKNPDLILMERVLKESKGVESRMV